MSRLKRCVYDGGSGLDPKSSEIDISIFCMILVVYLQALGVFIRGGSLHFSTKSVLSGEALSSHIEEPPKKIGAHLYRSTRILFLLNHEQG